MQKVHPGDMMPRWGRLAGCREKVPGQKEGRFPALHIKRIALEKSNRRV